MKEGKALRAWRPALGVLAVGVFAFSFTLRGAPPSDERTQGSAPGALTAADASVKTPQSSARIRVLAPQKADYRRSPVTTAIFEGATAVGPGPTDGGAASAVCGNNEQCSDCNPCTQDICTLGVCTNPPEPSGAIRDGCNDNLFCTGEELCDGAGGCTAGTPPCDWGLLGGTESCDELSEGCGVPCTSDADCDDDNVCTEDTCNPDNLVCDNRDICTPGRCCVGTGSFCNSLSETACTGRYLATDQACDPILPSGNVNGCPEYSAGIAPEGTWVGASPLISARCGAIGEYFEQYETNDHAGLAPELQYMTIEFLRFTGAVRSIYSARWDIAFYDEAGILVEDVFWPDGSDQNTTDWVTNTVDFDPPLVIPTKGMIGWSVQDNFSPGGLVQLRLTGDGVDIGTHWGGDGEIVAMELIGNNTSEPLGACCNKTVQECTEKRPWICKDDGGIYQGNGTACNICDSGPAQDFSCGTSADCNDVCDDNSTNVGESCTVDGDCVGGACDHTGGAACIALATCSTKACCDAVTGGCSETTGTCPGGTTSQGFGTTCDPNCCEQPLGSYSGADECDLIGLHVIHVPALGVGPQTQTVTITGNNSAATNDDQVACDVWGVDSQELGWWEGFTTVPAAGGPDCFNVRMDYCCTDILGEPLRPAWGNLVSGCDPCGALLGNAGVEPPIGIGRTTTGFARGGPFCAEDNLWGTFGPLRTGAYYYPIYTVPSGTSGVPPGATYQLHFTVGPCPVAACCNGEACEVVTELDCLEQVPPGYWLAPPNTLDAVTDCGVGAGICGTGSCCTGPGVCEDDVLGSPVTKAVCDSLPGDYVGGAACDNPGQPCPLCVIEDASTCQFLEPNDLFVTMSDVSAPGGATVLADNFIPTGTTASTVCVWGIMLDGRKPDDDYECAGDLASRGITPNFTVKIFDDNNGVPGTLIAARSITTYFEAEKRDVAGDFNQVYGATGSGGAGRNASAYQFQLEPPIVGLTLGQPHWLEVSANTALGPDAPPNSCEFNLLIKHDGGNPSGFAMAGTWLDDPGPGLIGTSFYPPNGAGRPFDLAFCIDCGIETPGPALPLGGCCSCYDPGPAVCTQTPLDACIEVGMWNQTIDTCVGATCDTVAPAGDVCTDAIEIVDGSYFYDATCATTTPETNPFQGEAGETEFGSELWYKYTATCTGRMRMSMCGTGSNYDSAVAMWGNAADRKAGACPGDADFTQIGRGADETCNGILDAGAGWLTRTVEPGDVFLFTVGGWQGANGPGQFNVECLGTPCIVAEPPLQEARAPDIGFGTRNRYLSIETDPADLGWPMAIRVTFVSLPVPYNIWDGAVMWVQQPTDMAEASGTGVGGTANDFSQAGLDCSEWFGDFSQYVGGVHIYHEGIVPGGTYKIEAIRDSCSLASAASFSAPLMIATSKYGDMNSCAGLDCSKSPDGVADFTDISGSVDKFKNLPTAISKSRTDILPEILDNKVDFSDISAVVDGFRGLPYPGVPSDVNVPCTTP